MHSNGVFSSGVILKAADFVPINSLMTAVIVSSWTLGLLLLGAIAYLALRIFVRALGTSPEAYEDEAGFHVTALPPREDARIWLQSRSAGGMMAECRPFPPSVSSPTSRPVS